VLDQLTPRWRWLVWDVYVVAWTTALLVPNPVSAGDDSRLRIGLTVFAKAVHVSAYAVLTVLTNWLGVRGAGRWALLAFLSAHTLATEGLQHVMGMGRTGSWRDVALDHVGIALGLALTWKGWRGPKASPPNRL
jgi:hypothetical protein